MKFKMNIKAVSVLAVVALGALHAAYAQVDSTGISALRGTPRLEAAAPIQNQWTSNWGQCVYRDFAADKSRLTINGTNYLCNKTANSVQALCCPA